MALALRMRLDRLNVTTAVVTLVEAAHELLDGAPSGAILEAHRALKRGEISLRLSAKVEEAGPHHVRLANGAVLPADLTVWAGGAPPANWLSACGLPSGSEGALQVEPTLRSPAAPHVFAAGSAATLGSTRRGWNRFALARRQGPVLAENLALTLRALASNQLARSVSGLQSVHLNDRSLFSLDGQDRAMLWWGEWGVTSRWGIAIKERLDRSALRRFQALCSE
jgi:NADH dehydrogenase FAD-containing subunit